MNELILATMRFTMFVSNLSRIMISHCLLSSVLKIIVSCIYLSQFLVVCDETVYFFPVTPPCLKVEDSCHLSMMINMSLKKSISELLVSHSKETSSPTSLDQLLPVKDFFFLIK